MILKDWLKSTGEEFNPITKSDEKLETWLNVNVVSTHGFETGEIKHNIFKEKYVYNWCKLENGYAVGWNENPARGWSYPWKKLK
jgi:hypothetical protein